MHVDMLTCDPVTSFYWILINFSGRVYSFLLNFISKLALPFSSISSVLGFALVVNIILQLISGFFLGWYYIPEPGLVIELREEMFVDSRFGFEIFNLHVRGVDSLFVMSYLHLLKKLYMKNYLHVDSEGWVLGGYAFFWFHYVVVLGISLSASHLSDLTLTIAANIF